MKNSIALILLISFSSIVFAQGTNLYDVNYDMPEECIEYVENIDEFQEIYLQYEEAIKVIEDKIRKQEIANKLAEIEKIRENALDVAREDIIKNERELIRNQETLRLTKEITDKVTQELLEEYEKKFNAEVVELKNQLSKEINETNQATTKRVYAISTYAFCLVIFIIVLLIVSRNRKKKQLINSLANEYYDRFVRENNIMTVQKIRDEINDKYSNKDGEIRKLALEQAKEHYEITKDLITLKEFEDDINESYSDINKIFSKWNGNLDDEEFLRGLINEFNTKEINLNQQCSNVVNTFGKREKNEITEFKNTFKTVAIFIKKTAARIQNELISNSKSQELKDSLKAVNKEYLDFAKQLKKGVFNE